MVAFPWLQDLPPRVMSQLRNSACYAGYLGRQEADIRAFRREEACCLGDDDGLPRSGRAVGRATWQTGGCQAGVPRGGGSHPGHDASSSCRNFGPSPQTRTYSIARELTFHVKQGIGLPSVSRETHHRLEVFVELLLRWTPTVNLISRLDCNVVWSRHIADLLQLAPYLTDVEPPVIDLGSGGGFPGLVLAIATAHHFHLIESDQRKAAFLREAARVTAAPVTVHASRIETTSLHAAAAVTARALAPLPRLIQLAVPVRTARWFLPLSKGPKRRRRIDGSARAVAHAGRADRERHRVRPPPS